MTWEPVYLLVGGLALAVVAVWVLPKLGIGSCHLRMNWPGMPASLSRRSLELFASEVLPSLREAGAPAP